MSATDPNYPTGKNAEKRGELCAALERAGYPEAAELVREAKPLLQMPDSLVGLYPIARHLADMDPTLRQWADGGAADLIHRWASAVLAISREELIARDPWLTRGKTLDRKVQPPTEGYKEKHPVWCALWPIYWNPGSPEAGVYQQLQAHFVSSWILLRQEADRDELRWVDAGRLLRKLHQPDQGWFVADLVGHVDRAESLCARLHAFKWDKSGLVSDDPLRQEVGAFGEVLARAHGLQYGFFEERTGGGGGGRRRPSAARVSDAMKPDHGGYWHYVDDELDIAGWGTRSYRTHGRAVGRSIRDDLHQQGQDPSEYDLYESAEVDPPWEEDDPGSLPPLRSVIAHGRAKGRRIDMAAQSLRVEPARVRMAEIAALVGCLQEIYAKSARSEEARTIRETVLLAAVSFVTGVAPSQARTVMLVNNVSELPTHYAIALNPNYGMWMRPYHPPERHALQGHHRRHALETWPRVVFEDAWSVGEQLAQHAPNRNDTDKRAFGRNYKTYLRRWNNHIAPTLKARGVSRYWRRFDHLGAILPSWIGWQSEGDHLPLRLLFGINDPRSAAQQYYTSWERADLAERYHDHLDQIWRKIRLPSQIKGGSLFQFRERRTRIDSSWVGDDRTPVPDSVKKLLGALRRRIRRAQREGRDRLEYHNDLAAYTALGLALATGARAVRTPVPSLRAIHRRSGTLGLQEKDQKNGTHARLVSLPQIVIEQVDSYLDHLAHLYHENPWLPKVTTVPATKHRDNKSNLNTGSYQLRLEDTLFFIRQDAGTVEIRESSGRVLKDQCDDVLHGHWPVENAGRHFLRGFLVEQRCPATLINTHLGHWHYGEAPWAGPSSMDPYRYRQEIRPYLDRLMARVGYQALWI